TNVNLLTFHLIRKAYFARSAVRELSSHRGQPIVLTPNHWALEISGLPQNSVQIDFAIEIKPDPFTDSGAIDAFDPRRRFLTVNCVRGIVSVRLHCQTIRR